MTTTLSEVNRKYDEALYNYMRVEASEENACALKRAAKVLNETIDAIEDGKIDENEDAAMTEKERAIEKYLSACKAVYYFNQEHDNTKYVAAHEIRRAELRAKREAFRDVLYEVFEMGRFEIKRLRDELRRDLEVADEAWPRTDMSRMPI